MDAKSFFPVARQARDQYLARISRGPGSVAWWDALLITSNSERQAEWYRGEIERRLHAGTIPTGVSFQVVPDPQGKRIGSGGATLNALACYFDTVGNLADGLGNAAWWACHRLLIIHSGGDSRRLPQYSLAGKLFTTLPIKTPWGESSTVFDEFLALSSAWAERLPGGLLLASGDVILTFDSAGLRWDRPGVSGVAIRQPVSVGSQHGVYVTDSSGRIYNFLQKPSAAQLRNAGGLLPGNEAAVDSGLLRFDPASAEILTRLGRAGTLDSARPVTSRGDRTSAPSSPTPTPIHRSMDFPHIDLYEHLTGILTGDWRPHGQDPGLLKELYAGLRGTPFQCDLVEGDFTHIGTTSLFRQIMTEETNLSRIYESQQQTGKVLPAGVSSSGVIIDSVFLEGGELAPGAVAIECLLEAPFRAMRGAMLHGIMHLPGPVVIPEDTVVHQVPVAIPGSDSGTVVRLYGVMDDPKLPLQSKNATWLGKPIQETLDLLGLNSELVWPGVAARDRSLWNAELFPVGSIREAWDCTCWMLGLENSYSAALWRQRARLSLASSTQYADSRQLAEARNLRLQAAWQKTAQELVEAGSDVRPLLASAPGLKALALVGQRLLERMEKLLPESPTEAASRGWIAARFLAQSGWAEAAEKAETGALAAVRKSVEMGVMATAGPFPAGPPQTPFHQNGIQACWQAESVTVHAPVRIDFGGGWSDTPPFCLDWGGTVLNMAILLEGQCPIHTTVHKIQEPLIRLVSGEPSPSSRLVVEDGDPVKTLVAEGFSQGVQPACQQCMEIRTNEELRTPPEPGCPFSIPRTSLQMLELAKVEIPLSRRLEELGGGLEIRTMVNLPMGSGLGTSSILASTTLKALAEMAGIEWTDLSLSDQVMRLEQIMTTGGGWQDQAGGIFPGAKIISSGPGLRQRLRHEPVRWSRERQQEFLSRFLLYYTGIQRIARNLLVQVVGRYLSREVATVQVLHSIKTLANEMAYAMGEGDWDYLGSLMNRHWELNQILDPHTTNAPLNAFLESFAPWISGAKLAGAGGGGFFMILSRSPEAKQELREIISRAGLPGRVYSYEIADKGLRVSRS